MSKTCFMFSGQGSQKPGMGMALAQCFPAAAKVFSCASDILNFDVLKLCSDETSSKLFQTEFAQPAIVAVSIAAFKALAQFNVEFQAVVGHSLGSIAALIASNVVSLEDGFKIVQARAQAMQLCEKNSNGAMCAIIGASISEVELACQNASDYVICANFNSPTQVVISGTKTAVNEVQEKLQNKATRCVMLKVNAAFHSKLMMPAAEMFQQALKSIEFKKTNIKIFSNVTGKQLDENSNIKELLVKQIYSPVKFTSNLFELAKDQFTNFIEFGPSRPLCAMVKSAIPGAKTFNVSDEISLNRTLEHFKN